MQFKDVIGQVETKNHLVDMFQGNRMAHALLFLGREGCGGLSLAIAFSQYVVCEKVNSKNLKKQEVSLFANESGESELLSELPKDSCGECSACVKARQLAHPDIHFSYPTVVRNPNDNKPIATDYILEWRDFIKQHPYGNAQDWIEFLKEHR